MSNQHKAQTVHEAHQFQMSLSKSHINQLLLVTINKCLALHLYFLAQTKPLSTVHIFVLVL